jgi:hypothetical protein
VSGRVKYRVVPFERELRPGEAGEDVFAVQRALAKVPFEASVRGTDLRGHFDTVTLAKVRRFQQRSGLHVDGVYGAATHAKLAPYFDDYGAWLMGAGAPVDADAGVSNAIVACAVALYNVRDRVHYSQSNRMNIVRERLKPPFDGVEIYEDCSSSVTGCYFVAGAPDPNGLGYDGQGYTGTLCQHGAVVSLASAKPGDLVLYGHGAPWEHVAMYLGGGKVWSHGSEGGPYVCPVDYRGDRGEIRTYPKR